MTAAADARAAAQNTALAATIGRVQAGHLAAQKALHLIREGEHPDLLEVARQSLGGDEVALAAFARSIAKGRE